MSKNFSSRPGKAQGTKRRTHEVSSQDNMSTMTTTTLSSVRAVPSPRPSQDSSTGRTSTRTSSPPSMSTEARSLTAAGPFRDYASHKALQDSISSRKGTDKVVAKSPSHPPRNLSRTIYAETDLDEHRSHENGPGLNRSHGSDEWQNDQSGSSSRLNVRNQAIPIMKPAQGHQAAITSGLSDAVASPGGVTSSMTMCLCQPDPKIPRPRNAFILYRQHFQAGIIAQNPGLSNPEISKIIGEHWRSQSPEIKNAWKALAEEEKARHQQQYPDYRYQPRRNGRGNSVSSASTNTTTTLTLGDTPRCVKCGGRVIITPHTPNTPFTPRITASITETPPLGTPASAYPQESPYLETNILAPDQRQVQGVGLGIQGLPRLPPVMAPSTPIHSSPQHHRRRAAGAALHAWNDQQDMQSEGRGAVRQHEIQEDESHHPQPPDPKRRRLEFSSGVGADSVSNPGSGMSSPRPPNSIPPSFQREPIRRGSLLGTDALGQTPTPLMGPPPRPQRHDPSLVLPPLQTNHPSQQQPQSQPLPVYASSPHQSYAQIPRGYPSPASTARATYLASSSSPVNGALRYHALSMVHQNRRPGVGVQPHPLSLSHTHSYSQHPHPHGHPHVHTPLPHHLAPPQYQYQRSPPLISAMIPAHHSQTHAQPQAHFQARQSHLGSQTSVDVAHSPQIPEISQAQQARNSIEAMVMTIPTINKIKVLNKISPPLAMAGYRGAVSPIYETRGAVVAIEGAPGIVLDTVVQALEEFLTRGGECAVRVIRGEDDGFRDETGLGRASDQSKAKAKTMNRKENPINEVGSGMTFEKRAEGISQEKKREKDKEATGESNSIMPDSTTLTMTTKSDQGKDPVAAESSTISNPLVEYLDCIKRWHGRCAEIIKFVTSRPRTTTTSSISSRGSDGTAQPLSESTSTSAGPKSSAAAIPVALVSNYVLAHSDAAAIRIPITDAYAPVDHWQWMATLWRGTIGPDLTIYVKEVGGASATAMSPITPAATHRRSVSADFSTMAREGSSGGLAMQKERTTTKTTMGKERERGEKRLGADDNSASDGNDKNKSRTSERNKSNTLGEASSVPPSPPGSRLQGSSESSLGRPSPPSGPALDAQDSGAPDTSTGIPNSNKSPSTRHHRVISSSSPASSFNQVQAPAPAPAAGHSPRSSLSSLSNSPGIGVEIRPEARLIIVRVERGTLSRGPRAHQGDTASASAGTSMTAVDSYSAGNEDCEDDDEGGNNAGNTIEGVSTDPSAKGDKDKEKNSWWMRRLTFEVGEWVRGIGNMHGVEGASIGTFASGFPAAGSGSGVGSTGPGGPAGSFPGTEPERVIID